MKLGFREDKRAVSALVGAILLLAILIIALSSYQAFIVPNQNAETEFDHNQQVEDEMVDFRNALYEARLDDRERASSVKLGTRYQSRTLAVNPPPATGALQSEDGGNISVSGGDTEFELVGNQFFEYTPSYSEYRDAGTIRYENTIVYHDFESANVELTGQRLVDGDTVRLIPSEPSIDENGIDRVTYEPKPSRFRVFRPDDAEITFPTELDPGEWSELLEDQDDWDVDDETNGEVTLEYVGDDEPRIIYSPVDRQENLPEDERDEDDGDDATEINPASPGAVILQAVDYDKNTFTLTFNNTGNDTREIDRGRISFLYKQSGGNRPTSADVSANAGSNTWDVGADFRDLPGITEISEEGGTIELEYAFDGSIEDERDFFVTSLEFENGERSTYFVSSEFSAGGTGGTPPGLQ